MCFVHRTVFGTPRMILSTLSAASTYAVPRLFSNHAAINCFFILRTGADTTFIDKVSKWYLIPAYHKVLHAKNNPRNSKIAKRYARSDILVNQHCAARNFVFFILHSKTTKLLFLSLCINHIHITCLP